MGLIHNNFESLQANVRELTLAVRNDKELKNLLPCVTSGGTCCQKSIKPYYHRRKKIEVDPGTLPQLRWSSMCKGTLFALEKEQKNLTCTLVTQRNTFFTETLKNF